MGGFEGGDEAGFWDEDDLKNDIFTSQKTCNQHLITHMKIDASSFCISVYSTSNVISSLQFVQSSCEGLKIEGKGLAPNVSKVISKTYETLLEETNDFEIEDFFKEYKVVVDETQAIADASFIAAFLLMTKEACSLALSMQEIEQIGISIDAQTRRYLANYYKAAC